MKDETLHQLNRIIEALDIDRDRGIRLRGQDYPVYRDFLLPEAYPISHAIFLKGLQSLLYNEFYSKDEETPVNPDPGIAASTFAEQLRKANTAVEGFDKAWVLEERTPVGTALIQKGGYKRLVQPGAYILPDSEVADPEKGESVWLFQHRRFDGGQYGFYYVFGGTLLENNPTQWIRLYFNLKPEGAPILLHRIPRLFDRAQLPFTCKCLADPGAYNRTDAGVLYLDKRYFEIASRILAPLLSDLKPFMKERVPLFTKKLVPGLGFAENPFDPKESFGLSRCKMIAEGISHALEKELPKTTWLESILAEFEKNQLNIEAPYLNPNSHYPYSFDSISQYYGKA